MAKFDEPLTDAELIALRDTHIPAIPDTDELELQVLVDQFEIGPLTQEGSDFKVYRGQSTIPGGASSVTIVNGTDFSVPRWVPKDRAFLRITNTRITGAGRSSGGAGEGRDPSEFTVHVQATGADWILDRDAGVQLTRPNDPDGIDCVVDWEVVAYVGEEGGANEFVVRQLEHKASSGSTNTITGTAGSYTTFADVMVWITGQSIDSTGTDWAAGLWTSLATDIGGGSVEAGFIRGVVTTTVSTVSYAMIEFVGSNWTVTRKPELTTGAAWAPGTTTSFDTSLGITVTPEKTFLVLDYRTTNNPTGLDDAGDATLVKDADEARHWNRVTTGSRLKNYWIIENSQASGVARNMNVESELHDDDTTTPLDARSWDHTLATAIGDLDETSVIATASVDGGGSSFPRGAIGYRLTSPTQVSFFEADAGQERRIAIQTIEWPRTEYTGALAVRQNPEATKTALYAEINSLLP